MTVLDRAWRRAKILYPDNKRLRNTYYRGCKAASEGKPIERCPYSDDGRNTWRTSLRKAWRDGWRSMR